MKTELTPEMFARAAAFYEQSPTGQYDGEAEHALRCHFDLLRDAKRYRWLRAHDGCPFAETDDAWYSAEALDKAVDEYMAYDKPNA